MSDQRLRALQRRLREGGSAADLDAFVGAWRRVHPDATYLVVRARTEGLWGRRVLRLTDTSPLEWFRSALPEASRWDGFLPVPPDAIGEEWARTTLGAHLPALVALLSRAGSSLREGPETWEDLDGLLRRHGAIDGEGPVIEPPSLRLWTSDAKHEYGMYWFTRSYAAAYPERVVFLLHEPFALPSDWNASARFDASVEPIDLEPSGDEEGATYFVDLYLHDTIHLSSLESEPAAFRLRGVRVPELAEFLHQVEAEDDWPDVLFALRNALLEEDTLEDAVLRCADEGLPALADLSRAPTAQSAREELEVFRSKRHALDAPSHVEHVSTPHLLQGARRVDGCAQTWVVFDDLWAGSHSDLAESLLRSATHWDPLRP